MTPADLKAARHELGLSAAKFARLVGITEGRTVYRWESGDTPIPGPIEVIVELLQKSAEARRLLLLPALALVAALVATPALAREATDPKKCELPISQLNLQEIKDCDIYMRATEGIQRQFDELRARQDRREPASR